MLDSIKKLVEINGVSGNETAVVNYIKSQITPYVDKIYTDVMGNLVAVKRGAGRRIMFMAHTDEIGVVATFAGEDGLVRVSEVGGINPKSVINSYVTFENGVRGVFTAPVKCDAPKISECYVDIGCKTRDEVLAKIDLGMTARFDGDTFLMGDTLVSKALDDRVGCYILIEAIKAIKESPNEIYFVFTTQEEVGLRGARVCSFDINPDIAIAVDSSSTFLPDEKLYGCIVGEGAGIKLRDAFSICSKAVVDALTDTAEKNEIPYQRDAKNRGGTDIGAVQAAGRGAHIGAVTVPMRNLHTLVETASVSDIKAACDLLIAFAQKDIENIL